MPQRGLDRLLVVGLAEWVLWIVYNFKVISGTCCQAGRVNLGVGGPQG